MVTRSSEVAGKSTMVESTMVGSTGTESTGNKLLNHICDFQPDGMDGPETASFQAFLAVLFSNTPEGELADIPVARLRATGVSFWRFGEQRESNEAFSAPKVRVFNPDCDANANDRGTPCTVLEIVCDDMSFLVASMMAEINERDLEIEFLAHPIVDVARDKMGARKVQGESSIVNRRESMIHIEVSCLAEQDERDEFCRAIEAILAHVGLAVRDWKAMDQRFLDTFEQMQASCDHIPQDEFEETSAFLKWLSRDHFLFFGARDYVFEGDEAKGKLVPIEGSNLGVLSAPDTVILRRPNEPRVMASLVRESLMLPSPIIVSKSNMRSMVHRRAYMDYIGIKLYSDDGRVIGERRFVGLFASAAYNRSTRDIPFVRRKAALVVERAGFLPDSHDANALYNIIENFPRDELFQIDVEDLSKICIGILRLGERPRAKVFLRHDPFERYISALVYFPRERFSSKLRKQVGRQLAKIFHGRQSIFYTQMGNDPLARVHYIIGRSADTPIGPSDKEAERQVIELIRSWADKLEDALTEDYSAMETDRLARCYGDGFTEAYKEAFEAVEAASDIKIMEALKPTDEIAAHCYRVEGDAEYSLRLKLTHEGDAIPLSDCMPMLENMGLDVVTEFGYQVRPFINPLGGERRSIWIHDFYVEQSTRGALNVEALREVLEPAILAIWNGEAEDDGFNCLIVTPGFAWRDVAILRACAKYRLQTGISFSQTYMEQALAENPLIAGELIELFKLRHDPELPGDTEVRKQAADPIRTAIIEALEHVESLDQDRIIRRILNLIDSMTRTNFYKVDETGERKSFISFKLNSAQIEELPEPRPFAEIFVYSPRVEGVHLRCGPVGRGGLRWSDRREDFRTEVLGLVKAQQIKNAVIVPVGAKGGFFPKQLPIGGTRQEIQAEAIEAYKIFVSGLLDLTDNFPREGGADEVIRPDNVMCYDGPDPYLVVAADKGTATFSDIANDVSKQYGFWLGDAFASGGSVGYDHKVMGITARGAWEAVKRHFRELGKDIQTTSFSVIGVGDMSGDVFGNGMLLSKHTKLVAAFDHRHIFVDPTPDEARTWEERKRLFDTPRSSWNDYDRGLISQGGGVFNRAAKAVPVSPEMASLLDLPVGSVTPIKLMEAILLARADLLWFGGIGTYVKSAEESHYEVGDRANDGIRIDGRALRAKVVGEGANLGLTQRGRIEFARNGGCINMDAIDNAAGVDCSDHEVNIKILVDAAMVDGRIEPEERKAFLEGMTEMVSELVLKNHYDQSLGLTIAEGTSQLDRDSDGRLMRALERIGRLNRELEFLPGEDNLEVMAESGQGLSRPELAILMSYTKATLFDALLASDLPDDPYLEAYLMAYFPQDLQDNFPDLIVQHRLRREIIATELANEIVDTGGITFAHRLCELSGASVAEVARAFVVTMALFRIDDIREQINGLDNIVSADIQTEMHLEIHYLLRHQVAWFLSLGRLGEIGQTIERYADGIAEVRNAPRSVVIGVEVSAIDQRVKHWTEAGVDHNLASSIATLRPMVASGDIVDLSHCSKLPIAQVASAYFLMGAELRLDRLRDTTSLLSAGEHYDRLAIKRIASDLAHYQQMVSEHALMTRSEETGNERVRAWLQENHTQVGRFRQLFGELEASGGLNIAKLSLLGSQMHDLVQSLRTP